MKDPQLSFMMRYLINTLGRERVQEAFTRALQTPRVTTEALDRADKAALQGPTAFKALVESLPAPQADALILTLGMVSEPLRAEKPSKRQGPARKNRIDLDAEVVHAVDEEANRLGVSRDAAMRIAIGYGIEALRNVS